MLHLFQRLRTQCRYRNAVTGYSAANTPIITSVPCGLDYTPAITLMQFYGWDIDLGLELLQVIEIESLSMD